MVSADFLYSYEAYNCKIHGYILGLADFDKINKTHTDFGVHYIIEGVGEVNVIKKDSHVKVSAKFENKKILKKLKSLEDIKNE